MRGKRLFTMIDYYIGIPLCVIFGTISRFISFLSPPIRKFERILIIKLSAIGDTILALPMIHNLRRRFPDAHISIVVSSINKEVVERCIYLDEIILLKLEDYFYRPLAIISFFYSILKRKFQLVIDCDQWLRISAIISSISFAKEKIGFFIERQYKYFPFTKIVKHIPNKHEFELFNELARKINGMKYPTKLRFEISSYHLEEAKNKLLSMRISTHEPFIVIHPETPAHGWQREWPIYKYIELLKLIETKFDVKILVSGTPQRKDTVMKIVSSGRKNVYPLIGLTLCVLGGILKYSKLLICSNTGIMHLASALEVPVVALHGPTNPLKWGPLNLNSKVISSPLPCSPCLYLGFEYGCKSRKCMESIEVKQVFAAVSDLLTGYSKVGV